MKLRNYFILLLVIVFSVIFLTGCESKDDTKELKEKADSELNYFEERIGKIIDEVLLNEYEKSNQNTESSGNSENNSQNNQGENQNNNGNNQGENQNNNGNNQGENQNNKQENSGENNNQKMSDVKEINWEQMNEEVEKIYSSWSVFAIDLNKLNVDNQDIIAFGENINSVKLAIQNKQETMLLESLNNLYGYIPRYMSSYSQESFEIAKKNIKYYIISGGILAQSDRWDECIIQIENAENEYLKLMNNVNYVNENSYNVNKIYILIEELKNSISYRNKDIFLLKYKTLINEF